MEAEGSGENNKKLSFEFGKLRVWLLDALLSIWGPVGEPHT